MAILFIVEDHRQMASVLTKEAFRSDGEALSRAWALMCSEGNERQIEKLAARFIWMECDDGRLMNDAAVRSAAHSRELRRCLTARMLADPDPQRSDSAGIGSP